MNVKTLILLDEDVKIAAKKAAIDKKITFYEFVNIALREAVAATK